MPEIAYRNATPEDVPAILALWRKFWPKQPYEVNLENKINSDPELVLLAETEGKIVATIIGGFDGWWGWMYRLAVDEDYRGQGTATSLMRKMHERLKSRGAKTVNGIVSPVHSDKKMDRILKKLGYLERGDKRVFVILK